MQLPAAVRGPMMLGVLGLALLTSSCSATRVDASARPGDRALATTGATSTPHPSVEVTETPRVSIPRPADPLAGRYTPVKRNGRAPAPTISAPSGSFTKAVRYPDGTTLQVLSVKQGVVSGQGPGVFPGQPTTTVALRLTNGSTKAINVSEVVVTATYGTPRRVASPVYDASASDFGGVVAPGAFVDATYVFSIPTSQLGSVVMIVDFDGLHVFARFAGAAR